MATQHNRTEIDKRIVYLDSINRSRGTIETPTFDIHPKIDNVLGFEVLQFDMPFNPFYNFTTACDTFDWQDSGGNNITSTIPVQNYTEDQLASEIETQMNADTIAADTYTVEYDAQTGKMTFTIAALTFQLLPSTTTNSLYEKVGIESDQTGGSTYTGTGIVDMNELFYVYLQSKNIKDILLDAPRDAGCLSNSLHRVKIDNDFKRRLDNHIPFPVFINCNGDKLSEIDIRLVDRLGNLVDMNGVEWSITIQIFYEFKKRDLRMLRN